MIKAQKYRQRLNSYANRNVKKSKFEFGRDDNKNSKLILDLKYKGRPPMSDFGKEIQQQEMRIKNQSKRMLTSHGRKSGNQVFNAQQRKEKERQEEILQQEVAAIKNKRIQGCEETKQQQHE